MGSSAAKNKKDEQVEQKTLIEKEINLACCKSAESILLQIRCPACDNDDMFQKQSTWIHNDCGELLYIDTNGDVFCAHNHSKQFIKWRWACSEHSSDYRKTIDNGKFADDFLLLNDNMSKIIKNSNQVNNEEYYNDMAIIAGIMRSVAIQFRESAREGIIEL